MKLPKHKCELSITHNEHKSYYLSVKEYLHEGDDIDWQSLEHKQRAIETDEIWQMRWYPETPVGFYSACAPTLEELLEFVNSKDWK